MTRASTDYENKCLTGGATGALFESLHLADPGTSGLNEISGSGYVRQSISWGAASGGSISNTNSLVTTVPAGTTIAFFGTYTAVSAGTYEIGGLLSATIVFTTSGTFTIAPSGLTLSAS